MEVFLISGEKNANQRVFRKLRVSLTRSCNFGCVYCAHDGKPVMDNLHTRPETFARWIQRILAYAPIDRIRLTGGEPTIYPDLLQLIQILAKSTTAELSMTTNGFRLPQLAQPLRDAGLTAVNISLDATDEDVFTSMGGRAYRSVIAGIGVARSVGLRVRLNATLVREMNESQILPLIAFARGEGVTLRFLELMDMGHLHGANRARLVPADLILREIGQVYDFTPVGRAPSETAEYYEMPDGYRFGIVGNSSLPFCNDCDRLRLDAQGRIFGCLSNPQGISIDAEGSVAEILEQAMALKQPQRFSGSKLVMREVGG